MLLDPVQLRAQAGERGAQVVGDVVAHAFDFVHQPLNAVEHGVDDGGQHVQFVTPVGQRQTVGQVARDNRLGTGLNGPNALQRTSTQQVPARNAGDDGQRQAPEQRVQDDPRHREQRAVIAHQHQ